MKIYNDDGTCCKVNPADSAFGWSLDDIPTLEIVLPDKKTKKNKIKEGKNESSEPIVVQEATSSIDFDLNTEKENINENIDKKIPRSQILDLINPCTIESKMLLSVVHYAMYKNFNPEMIKILPLQDGARIQYLENTEEIISDGIINYHQYKNKNIFPLLVELILTHNKCDVHEIVENDMETDQEHLKKGSTKKRFEKRSFETLAESLLCDPLIQRIHNLRVETEDLHDGVSEIRCDFQKEVIRVDGLIKKAQILEKDLRETKFLDDLVHLLNGDLQHVVLKESPFRIFLGSEKKDDQNFII